MVPIPAGDLLKKENARSEAESFIRSIPEYPGCFHGQGIVIPGGGINYFPSAWVAVRMLRWLGCNLPIQLWHLGEPELDSGMRRLMEPWGVECVDGLELLKRYPIRRLGGWELKAYALLYCSFEEVLLLDADVVPLIDVSKLFEWKEYQATGAIFWPDMDRFAPDHPIWEICGVQYQDEPQVESSQLLIHKARCWKAVNLALFLNNHSEFYYNYIYGDKDTFHFAFRKVNQPYEMPHRLERIRRTNCHHDFSGKRIFQHRNYDKWNLFIDNERIPGFLEEDTCFRFLEELKQSWAGHSSWDRFVSPEADQELLELAERFVQCEYIYHRVGYDFRPMTFALSGGVANGRAPCEMLWNLKKTSDGIYLTISSDTARTCELRRDVEGGWKGQWLVFEKMPVHLCPKDKWKPQRPAFLPLIKPCPTVEYLTSTRFRYRRLGHDERIITFERTGLVGLGAAPCEVFWQFSSESHPEVLEIWSERSITCALWRDRDGVWRGRWLRNERMPVEVAPVSENLTQY